MNKPEFDNTVSYVYIILGEVVTKWWCLIRKGEISERSLTM